MKDLKELAKDAVRDALGELKEDREQLEMKLVAKVLARVGKALIAESEAALAAAAEPAPEDDKPKPPTPPRPGVE